MNVGDLCTIWTGEGSRKDLKGWLMGFVVDKSSLNDDVIWACVRMCDGKYPDDSPHVPWYWNGAEWREWRSKIHSDKGG